MSRRYLDMPLENNRQHKIFISRLFTGIPIFYAFYALLIFQPIQVLAAQNKIYADSTTVNSGESVNWAGYAATGGTFTGITGTWTVPTVNSINSLSTDASWVGIGGVSSNDLIQAGTQTVVNNGNIEYQAWTEALPNPSQAINLSIKPGDSITVSIIQQSTGIWAIYFTDNTTGQSNSTTINYSSTLSSAEWIEERPEINNILPALDNFGSVSFSGATTIENGSYTSLGQSGAQKIDMYSSNSDSLLASTSIIGTDNQSFTVTRSSNNDTAISSSIPSGRIGGYIPHSNRGHNRQFLTSPNFRVFTQNRYNFGFGLYIN
jgi:hypothetical protein